MLECGIITTMTMVIVGLNLNAPNVVLVKNIRQLTKGIEK